MSRFLYFAYGSNLLLERLQARCPSAKRVGLATVPGMELAFWKKSQDGSGKGMLTPSSDSARLVYGVLYELDESERDELHRHEGKDKGYDYEAAYEVVRVDSGEKIHAAVYQASASHIDKDFLPYDWYLALVVAGARQSSIPTDYVTRIRAVKFKTDAGTRQTKTDALTLLKQLKLGDPKSVLVDPNISES